MFQQGVQRPHKPGVLFPGPFFGALQPDAALPEPAGSVAGEQQRVDVLPGVQQPVLGEGKDSPGKAERRETVVLGYGHVPRPGPVGQGEVGTVRPLGDDHGFRALPFDLVGKVTEDNAGNSVPPGRRDGLVHHRTAVRVDQKPDCPFCHRQPSFRRHPGENARFFLQYTTSGGKGQAFRCPRACVFPTKVV